MPLLGTTPQPWMRNRWVDWAAVANTGRIGLCWNGMHVDAKGTVGRYPALLARATLRHLRSRFHWGLAELETAAGLTRGNGLALVRPLQAAGLIESAGRGT